MSDRLQQAWQSQSPRARITIDPELLLNELRRNQRNFRATIFWRDVREVGISLLLVPVLWAMGRWMALPWTWYLMIPAVLWMAGFMLVDRLRQRTGPRGPAESLTAGVESSLAEVEHQIWLLRNVLWWYILPPAVPMAIFCGHVAWQLRAAGWALWLIVALVLVQAIAIMVYVYRLNLNAVRTELVPRRDELKALLAGLEEEEKG